MTRSFAHVFAVLSLVLVGALEARAALTLSIEMGPDRARPSESFTAQLTVANNGAAAVAGVVLSAPVPAGISSINPALSSFAVSCPPTVSNNFLCDPTEVMSWTLGTIPAGTSVTVSVGMFVAAATSAGTVITLNGSTQGGAVTGSASVTVSTSNALMLAVDEDQDPVAAGGTLIYTLTYGNRSTGSVTGTSLSFPVPAGATFVSATGGGTFGAGSVTWALGDLPAGQSSQQQVQVTVGGGLVAGSVLVVDAAVLSGTSTVAETARASSVASVANAALGLAIELNPDPVRPSERTVAQLTVTNRTVSAIFSAALQVRIPAGVTTVNPALATGVVDCPAGISNNFQCDPVEIGNWALGTIPAGEAITLSIPFPVGSGTPPGRLITLETLVKGDGAHQTAVKQTVVVDNDHPLTLAVDENADPIAPGGTLTYTLTYGNRSTSSVTGTALSFPVPAGTSFVSATGGGSLVGNNVEWALGNLPATQSDQQQVVVSVGGGLSAGSLLRVDAALLSGTTVVAETARATAATTVGNPFLGLAVQVNPDAVRNAEWAVGELTVTNRTLNAMFGVVLEARIPQGVDTVNPALVTGVIDCPAGISNNFQCDAVELGSWSLGTLPAGGSITLSIPFRAAAAVTSPSGRLLTLEALVRDDSTHQSLTRQTFAVDSDHPMTLALDDDADPVRAGGVLTYTVTYANRSTTSMTGTTLSFPVPAGTTFVSATDGGSLVGGSVQWALGNLPATQSDQRQVAVAVNAGLAGGSLLVVDAAQISGTGVVPERARATAATSVTTSPVLGLAVEVNPDPVRPGEWADAKLTVTNRSAASVFGVVLRGRVPQGVNTINPGLVASGIDCPAGISNNFACDAVEIVPWTLGTIPAGRSVSVWLPLPITNSAALVGRLLGLEALVSDDSSHQSVANQTIAVDSDGPLTLSVDDDVDAVVAGNLLTYSLSYGNRSTTAMTGATLSFPIPALGTLAGSTGGTLSGGRLVWNLGTVPAGTGGRRKAFVTVPGTIPAGSILLPGEAVLRATGVLAETSRGTVATAVEASKPLLLGVSFGRDPTQASAALTADLSVTNNTGANLTGVVLEARVPISVGSFNPALLTGGGTCIFGISNNFICDAGERASWSLGTIAAGATVAVSMPTTVIAGLANGRLMYLDARVTDDTGRLSTQSRTALVAPFVDGDADLVADIYDNCPFFANVSQLDTDLDGRGDECECGDQSGDGRNTVADLVAINLAIFNPGIPRTLCDANGDNLCNVNDIIAANLEIFSPGSTSTCARQPIPGP